MLIFHQNFTHFCLYNLQMICIFQNLTHGSAILCLISLCTKGMNCRTFGNIQHFRLNKGLINNFSHLATQGIQFPDQMTLGTSSNVRITRHQSNTVNTDCKNCRLKTQSCTGKCCFAACMTGAYYYGIHIFFYNWHMILPYLPIQNLLKISLTRSSPTDSPVILPNDSYASIRSME